MKLFPRILLVTVLGALVAAGAVFAVKARLAQMNPDVMLNLKEVKPDSRPAPAPAGTFDVKLSRSELPQMPVAGFSDNHDVLLSTGTAEYDYHSGGQAKQLKADAPNVRYNVTSSGQLIQLAGERITSGTSPTIYPFNESADRPKFFGDGYLAVVRKNISVKPDFKRPAGDFYVLTRETQRTTDKGSPLTEGPSSGGGSTQDKRVAAIPQGYFNLPVKSEELFVSPKRLTVLTTDDKASVWVSAREGKTGQTKETLLKFSDGKSEEVPMPEGYVNVLRMAVTGETVAATFGIVNGKLPFRSFVSQGKDWKELPLPSGFDCSFVQQVLSDGTILGYVTTWEGKNMKSLLWKGDSVAVLNDLPAWPKKGDLSLITRSNRVGDICVRNITDAASGSSEYYLLKLSL